MLDETDVMALARRLAAEKGISIEHARALVLRVARQRDEEASTVATGGNLDADKLAAIEREAGIL